MCKLKTLLLGMGAAALLATTALAAPPTKNSAKVWTAQTNSQGRQVKVWRTEQPSDPPAAPNLGQNDPVAAEPLADPVPDSGPDRILPEPIQANQMTAGQCDQCGANPGCCECIPFWAHRNSIYADALYLRPTGVDMAYAIQQNGVGGPGTVPAGRVGVVDPQFNTGFRIGFARACSDCSSIGASYTNFHSHDTDTLTAPDGLGGTVQSLVLHPNSVNAGSTSSLISAGLDIDFQLADIDYKVLLGGGPRHYLNYLVGVRYGNLRQDFDAQGQFTQPSGSIHTTTSIRFDGVGARTGFDGAHRIGCRGLSVYGKSFISVLFGNFRTSFLQVDETSTIVQASSNWRDERVVPVLDYEVGARWTSFNNRWSVSGGYYTAFWFNAITTGQYVQAVQTANFVNLGDTVAFTGFVTRLEYRF